MTDKEVQEEIGSLYKRINRNNKSARYFKCDLHVHSPASKDYVKVDSKNDDITEYILLIESFAQSDTNVIAITDHNTSKGYYEIKKLLNNNKELQDKLYDKLILPGVEITCYGKHFLAIFQEEYPESKLNALLTEAGIDVEEQGTEKASADRLSPLMLCEKVNEYGGIIIIAHADSENGLLQNYFKNKKNEEADIRGKSIQKILMSDCVYGICYNSEINFDRLIDIRKNLQVEHVSLIRASDSHSAKEKYTGSGLPLGSRKSWLKMGKLSYNALKLALRDENSRVKNNKPEEKDNPTVMGICVYGGFISDINGKEWTVIPFSEELNCIIGARGTGKSTLIDILKFILNPKNEDIGKTIIGRFNKAVVFMRNQGTVFAIRMNNPVSLNKLNITYYQLKETRFIKVSKNAKINMILENESDFVLLSEYLNSAEIQGFRQKDILELAKMELGPTVLIRSLCGVVFKESYIQLKKDEEFIRDGIKEQCKELKQERRFDANADLSSQYLDNQYNRFIKIHENLNDYMKKTIDQLNEVLNNEIKITYKIEIAKDVYENFINNWTKDYWTYGNYESMLKYKKYLLMLFEKARYDYRIMYELFTFRVDDIVEKYQIEYSIAELLCKFCFKKIDINEVVVTPQLIIEYDLNVAHGISNKLVYINRNKLSYGQKAVGMLLLILTGATKLGENRTLVIDQPEDDLDNSYIYHTLVKQFKEIKKYRQLIIATHNPNIPIAGDAENIIIMSSNGIKGWIELSGNIDNEKLSERVLQILEGDIEAFKKRAEKYGYKLIKVNN